MCPLHLTAFSFTVYKDCKISLKFLFQTCIINNRVRSWPQQFLCQLAPRLSQLYRQRCRIYLIPVSPLVFPDKYDHHLFSKLFRRPSRTLESFWKMISLYLSCVMAIAFSSSYLDIKFLRGIFSSFASCNNFDNVYLLIYFL